MIKYCVAGDRPFDRRIHPLQPAQGTKAKVITVQRISGPEKFNGFHKITTPRIGRFGIELSMVVILPAIPLPLMETSKDIKRKSCCESVLNDCQSVWAVMMMRGGDVAR